MSNVNYTTAGGTEIKLVLNGTLSLSVNGEMISGGVDLIDHPVHGRCLKTFFGGTIVKVPADKMDAVKAIFDDQAAKISVNIASDLEYDRNYNRIVCAMEG